MCEPRQYVVAAQAVSASAEHNEVNLSSDSPPPVQAWRITVFKQIRSSGKLCPVHARYSWSASVLVIALAGCGSTAHNAAPPYGQVTTAFKGSPPVLASLHAQANKLLAGGTIAFNGRIAALRGYPIVVNKWASWCGPCQTEFPAFQRAAVAYGRRVAFVGLDGKDSDPSAVAFLRRFPVTYPSYVDPQESIAQVIGAAQYYPQTVYYDRRGKFQYDHAGAYASAAALEQDIRRYALLAR
jgi:cytochrome c biogenesis protein CcmG/thiol:disulfide interchange protein DsbE